jgi:hypothetical protein
MVNNNLIALSGIAYEQFGAILLFSLTARVASTGQGIPTRPSGMPLHALDAANVFLSDIIKHLAGPNFVFNRDCINISS